MSHTITVSKINKRLKTLPHEKLAVVYDFISYLSEREVNEILLTTAARSVDCMFASEAVLRRDWDLPVEDEAWASL